MTNVLPGSRRDSVQLEKSASRITLLKTSPGAAHEIWVIILPLEMGVKVVLKHEREGAYDGQTRLSGSPNTRVLTESAFQGTLFLHTR